MNTPLRLAVDEPWDFRTQNGDNLVPGRLAQIVDEKTWAMAADFLISVEGIAGYLMLLHARYSGDALFNSLGADGTVVNVALFPSDLTSPVQHLLANMKPQFVMIGAIFAMR